MEAIQRLSSSWDRIARKHPMSCGKEDIEREKRKPIQGRIEKRYRVAYSTIRKKFGSFFRDVEALSKETRKRNADKVSQSFVKSKREELVEILCEKVSSYLGNEVTYNRLKQAKSMSKKKDSAKGFLVGYERVKVSKRIVSKAHVLFHTWYKQAIGETIGTEKPKVKPILEEVEVIKKETEYVCDGFHKVECFKVIPERASFKYEDIGSQAFHNAVEEPEPVKVKLLSNGERELTGNEQTRNSLSFVMGEHRESIGKMKIPKIKAIEVEKRVRQMRKVKTDGEELEENIEKEERKYRYGIIHLFLFKLYAKYSNDIGESKAKFYSAKGKTRPSYRKYISTFVLSDCLQDASMRIYEEIVKGETDIERLNHLAFDIAKSSFINRWKAEKRNHSLSEYADLYVDNLSNVGRYLNGFEVQAIQETQEAML